MGERFRVGVTDGAGHYKQFALANVDRLDEVGIYIGSDLSTDVVLACSEAWAAHVRRTPTGFEITSLAGTLERVSPTVFIIEDNRIELGVAARSGVPDRVMPIRLTEPAAVRPLPPLPPDPPPPPPPPPPKPPIVLGVTIDEASTLAALFACMRSRPRRPGPFHVMVQALAAGEPDEPIRTLLTLWRDRDITRIEIGELVLTDSALTTRLPVIVKGELYGEFDYSDEKRTDLLVLGSYGTRHFALRRYLSRIEDSPVEVDVSRGTDSYSGGFASVLLWAVQKAHERGMTTDIDPFFQS